MKMNKDWKAFLKESDTEIKKTSDQQAMLFSLSNTGIIKVSGEDAESFLQNQLTNDIRNVTETTHQLSAWCSPKGRIIATFQIFKRNGPFFLIASADLIEHLIKKLRMYVMMSKVTVEDVSDSLVHFAYSGIQLDPAPTDSNQTLHHKSFSILKITGNTPRFEIIGNFDDAKELWQQCAATASVVKTNGWNYLNILAGLPSITEASSEAWIPQMVNYIAIGGVDFKKGCYPGQEVVARLNYLGKTKRRMYRLQINTNELPAVGDSIITESGNDAGTILNAAINSDGKVEALAILKIAETQAELTLSGSEAGITLLDLPYSVDDE